MIALQALRNITRYIFAGSDLIIRNMNDQHLVQTYLTHLFETNHSLSYKEHSHVHTAPKHE